MIKSFRHGGIERFFRIKGDLDGRYAVWVDENWQRTCKFDGEHAELID
jgi:plasmid maintenance system killer protein